MDATDGFGVDCGVEAVGYQAHDPAGQEHPGLVLDALVQVVRATGKIGVVGVYEPSDEGAATEDAKHGRYDFDYGTAFTKGITIGSGQCPVMRYNRWLRDLIIRGQATALADHLARAAPGRRGPGLRPVRQARRRLDQGHPPPGRERLAGSRSQLAGTGHGGPGRCAPGSLRVASAGS